MHSISLNLSKHQYPIHVGNQLTKVVAEELHRTNASQVMLIMDQALPEKTIKEFMVAVPASVHCVKLTGGEACKSVDTLTKLYQELIANQFDRQSMIIALGGGSIGDVAGFVAATYMRGIAYAQVPTTLLAQVDASIGGKTAINLNGIKNIVGAFHQPKFVVCDIAWLQSLPEREFKSGFAEIIKIALTHDAAFFEWLELNKNQLIQREIETLIYAIKCACELKAKVVQADEKDEKNIRALLNFGHTFGHAIEACLGPGEWLHGEAVAVGMCLAAKLSQRIGNIKVDDVARIVNLIEGFGFSTALPESIGSEELIKAMYQDKKTKHQQLHFILLESIGKGCVERDVSTSLVI